MEGTMSEGQELLQRILQQEKEIQFADFNNETALQVGLSLLQGAQGQEKPITIDITRCGQQIFHYAMSGTAIDNDEWILRKNRIVTRFGHSSLYIGTLLKEAGQTLEEKYLISSHEYAAHGGAFPLIIRGVGPIGTITVSGMAQRDDHELVVSTLRKCLNVNDATHPQSAQYSIK